MQKEQRNTLGLTLIEILVVVLIIGILSAVSLPIFMGFFNSQCRGQECSGKDPNEQRCAKDAVTIAGQVTENVLIVELRHSQKCQASWTRVKAQSANMLSGLSIYLEDANGKKYGQSTIEMDNGYVERFSNMGPGSNLSACVEPVNDGIVCTEIVTRDTSK